MLLHQVRKKISPLVQIENMRKENEGLKKKLSLVKEKFHLKNETRLDMLVEAIERASSNIWEKNCKGCQQILEKWYPYYYHNFEQALPRVHQYVDCNRRIGVGSIGHVGNWINQHSSCVSQHGLIVSHGSLSLVMRSLTNTYGFWSNKNHDSKNVVSEQRSHIRYTSDSRWGGILLDIEETNTPCMFPDME